MATTRIGRAGIVAVTLAVVVGLVALTHELVRYRNTGTLDWGIVALAFGVPLVIFSIVRSASTLSTLPEATATFHDYPYDTYPQTSFHTAKVCDVVAVRIDYQPPLPPRTEAHISLKEFGGADAELGQATPPLKEIVLNAVGDGSLRFAFHFLKGRPPGSVFIVIKVAGRPTQNITVKIIT